MPVIQAQANARWLGEMLRASTAARVRSCNQTFHKEENGIPKKVGRTHCRLWISVCGVWNTIQNS